MKRFYLKHIFALLLFGSNGIIASHIALTSYEIVLFRTLLGSALLIVLLAVSRQPLTLWHNRRDALFVVLSGGAMGASWMFLYEAYAQVGVSIASLTYYCGPVLVMALSPLLFREKLTWTRLVGLAAVMLGLVCVNGGEFTRGGNLRGLICGGLSAVTYAAMVLLNKKAAHISGMENAALQLLAGFVTVAAFVGCKSGFSFAVRGEDWIWILVLGLLNTGIGCFAYFSSIGHLPVQTVAICGYLEPLSAVLLSVMFLRESLLPLQILGAAGIIGGAVFSECCARKAAVPSRTSAVSCGDSKDV